MHPSSSFTAIVPQTFEGHTVHAITYKGRPVVLPAEHARAIGADPDAHARLFQRMVERNEAEEGEDFIRLDYPTIKELSAKFDGDFKSGSNPIPSTARREMIALTREGAILLAMRSDAPRAAGFRKWAKKVLATVMETGRYEDAPRTALPTVREITGLLAELRRNKVPTSTIHGVTANLLGQLGIDFVPAASKPATAQLELPLPPAAPEPAPVAPPAPAAPKVDRSGDDWDGFVAAWSRKYGVSTQEDETVVSAADLLTLAAPFIKVIGGPKVGRPARFGKMLMARLDHVYGGLRIVHRNSTIRGYALYKAPRK